MLPKNDEVNPDFFKDSSKNMPKTLKTPKNSRSIALILT